MSTGEKNILRNKLMLNATTSFCAEKGEERTNKGSLIPRYDNIGGTPAEKITKAALIRIPRKPHTIALGRIPNPLAK